MCATMIARVPIHQFPQTLGTAWSRSISRASSSARKPQFPPSCSPEAAASSTSPPSPVWCPCACKALMSPPRPASSNCRRPWPSNWQRRVSWSTPWPSVDTDPRNRKTVLRPGRRLFLKGPEPAVTHPVGPARPHRRNRPCRALSCRVRIELHHRHRTRRGRRLEFRVLPRFKPPPRGPDAAPPGIKLPIIYTRTTPVSNQRFLTSTNGSFTLRRRCIAAALS